MSRAILALSALALVMACGCNNDAQMIDASSGAPRQVQPAVELVAKSSAPIADLPVPLGFSLDENNSRDYALAGARLVDHVYRGRPNKLAVKRFYERQMPVNRWTLTTSMFVRGDVMLDFEKETERCRILVNEGNLFYPTYIRIQLWTSGRVTNPGQQQ